MPAPSYISGEGASITSLCRIIATPTLVRICDGCSHVQTDEVIDSGSYYDKDYDILVESEDDDQIYEVLDGKTIFRTQHQISVLERKLNFKSGYKLLDYGCAKSSTYKALSKTRSDLKLHLFDVSDRYVSFWSDFLSEDYWATYSPRGEWLGYFDVVTSFFAFEHITEPLKSLQNVRDLLRTGGLVYCIVPNFFTNVADYIVVDHVNHFTPISIQHMLKEAGFVNIEIDEKSHRGAFIIVAEKAENSDAESINFSNMSKYIKTSKELGNFWSEIAEKVRDFELTIEANEKLAIYGSGFYGAFLSAALKKPENIHCFLDQNPHLVGRTFNGKPVIHPINLPEDLTTLMVGLNPANAKSIIEQIPSVSSLRKFFI